MRYHNLHNSDRFHIEHAIRKNKKRMQREENLPHVFIHKYTETKRLTKYSGIPTLWCLWNSLFFDCIITFIKYNLQWEEENSAELRVYKLPPMQGQWYGLKDMFMFSYWMYIDIGGNSKSYISEFISTCAAASTYSVYTFYCCWWLYQCFSCASEFSIVLTFAGTSRTFVNNFFSAFGCVLWIK